MNKEFLVGYIGFVGSNLAATHSFSGLFNSKNIRQAFGEQPDLLIYAGVRAEMFLANKNPEADRQLILEAAENIKKIQPKEIVLVSTIAVYPDTHGANEDTKIDVSRLTAYGANRRFLEAWVEENFENHLILRLPAIYGRNLKKNFLYDYIHIIPAMLTESKLTELGNSAPELLEYYVSQGNGFYKCRQLSNTEVADLKKIFQRLGFSALNFTDSRSVYQFYDLKNLWGHIQIARENGLRRLNLATPPIQVGELYYYLSGKVFSNELDRQPFDYDLRSKYAALFGGKDGYLINREQELKEIAEFIM